MGENLWGNVFMFIGFVIVPILLVYLTFGMGKSSYWEKYAARYGLNGFLELYRNWRNNTIFSSIFCIFAFVIAVFQDRLGLVSDPGSFIVGLTVLVGGCLLTMRPVVSMERRPRADYRKEGAKLVIGGGKDVSALLDKLDGEIKRGELILHPYETSRHYFLYQSAIVAAERVFVASPCIIPTDNVAYMNYIDSFSSVYLYDKHKMKLGGLLINKADIVMTFMSELEKRFGVQRDVEAGGASRKKLYRNMIIFLVVFFVLALITNVIYRIYF